jgi:Asp-tRNA(Asn)/Glu-tRNA(Gln) amidotransferase A subunit family amidase
MATTAADCALLLGVLAAQEVPSERSDELSVGVVEELFEGAIEPGVAAAAREAVEALREAGVRTTSVELPHLDRAPIVQQALQFPEATSIHLDWLRTRLADYGADVRGRLLAGLFVPATAYVTALRARGVIAAGFRAAAERFDCLVAPTLPGVAPVFGESGPLEENIFRQGLLRCTAPWSLVGWPVVSVSCGFVDGLPVGLSLIGRRFRDADALHVAGLFQRVTDWHLRRPAPVRATGLA